jgi:hypothetical protein
MRYTYLENYSGVMLTLRPDSQKHTLFAIKMENQNFMKQILKPYLEELFGMRRCTHLPSLGALLLCMLMFCHLHSHLGGNMWRALIT